MTINRRRVVGWTAVGISILFSTLWALWGAIEAFHEGWYERSWGANVLGALAYLQPMLSVLLPAMVAVLWRRVGSALHLASAAFVTWRFELYNRDPANVSAFFLVPLGVLAGLYLYGRVEPRKWALRILVGLPLVTVVVSGAYPGWLAVNRYDDGNYGLRIIQGNGVRLAWAPQGPGWPEEVATWDQARNACDHLSRDGLRREAVPLHLWRLPTVEESVRSAVRRGRNAGGTWDSRSDRTTYRVQPNKDTPLWSRYSAAIYRWTATEANASRAYRFIWAGFVNPLPKKTRIHYRCVAAPAAVANY